jgi:hypothetical protein
VKAARREFHIYLSIWRGTHAEITTARARTSSEKKTQKGWCFNTRVLFPICSSGWILSRTLLAVGVSHAPDENIRLVHYLILNKF